MDCSWTDIVKIVAGVIAALGGGGAIVAGLSSWLGKVWADRLMVKETAKFREDQERLTKQLERKNYVSKVRFDAEFAIYRELSEHTDNMVCTVSMLFPTVDTLSGGEHERKALLQKRYELAEAAYLNAEKCLARNAAFIPQNIYDSFHRIMELCKTQVGLFPFYLRTDQDKLSAEMERACWERTVIIQQEYDGLLPALREYLSNIDAM